MLHNAWDQDVGASDGITSISLPMMYLSTGSDALRDHVDDADKLINVLIADGDLHTLSAQHIGRAHQHGITQLMGRFGLLRREYGCGLLQV